ncbi:type II secretion system protein [Candidatus Gottesmanbacteria bacterium]|nr:type II secretion system protein [Candidatus Gottesmanbacteria bacterium]
MKIPNLKYQIPCKFQVSRKFQPLAGFTLLELLVVISILAILITLALTSFSTAQKKGRDAKRKSDVREIQSALEQYYSVCGYKYPTPTNFYSVGIYCNSPSIGILPTVPTDPKGTPPYYCGGTCDNSGFQVCAVLEAESPTGFCVSNQQ